MFNQSDVRRKVERALETAIQFKISDNPNKDPDNIMKDSLADFNKHFESVYKIDSVKLTKDVIDISLVKDKGFYSDEETVCV